MSGRPFAAACAVALLALAPATTGYAATASGSHSRDSSATPASPIGGALLGTTGVAVAARPAHVPALPTDITASSWLVADLDTGEVLAAKDPHGKFLPASTLKTLTAVTLIPLLPADQLVKVTEPEIAVDGSKVGLVTGMAYSVKTLFTSLLVVSANDAAMALAAAAGGTQHTVDLMQAEAQYLQADDTLVRTPSGLDGPGESSSAYDLALFARAGFAMPAFRSYVQTVRSTVPAPHHKSFAIYTHNHLLTEYPGDIGGKNGYTVAARGTYIGAATRNGHTILVTLMHANPDFWPEAKSLLNWGFDADGKVTPVGSLVAPLSAPGPLTTATDVSSAGSGRVALAAAKGDTPSTISIVALAISSACLVVVVSRRLLRRRAARFDVLS